VQQPRHITALASPGSEALLAELETALGRDIDVVGTIPPEPEALPTVGGAAPEASEAIATRISHVSTDKVLLVVRNREVEVVPYS
jgi:hypothetical protein